MKPVPPHASLCPEQIVSPLRADTPAALIDQWGRAHRVPARAVIGREPGACDIAVLESSISRRHAELAHDAATGAWSVRDLDSTNGTFVDEARVRDAQALPAHCMLRVGEVYLAFAAELAEAPPPSRSSLIGRTARAQAPALPIALLEPTGGGGGIARVGQAAVQLTMTQFAFVQLLIERMVAELDQPAEIRGFVRSSELAAALPWDTPSPQDNHVKQLVRRVRGAFERAGVGEVIEARHRFGYRLKL